MDRIRELRNLTGVSQARLAVTAGMDPATLNRIEQGKGNPNLKTLEKLADALGVEVAELFPKAQAPLPLDSGEERGLFPYPWMSVTLDRLIEDWGRRLEGEVDGRYAHAVAIAAMDTMGAVLLMGEPGETLRDRGVPENELEERSEVAQRLYELSGRAIDRYRDSDIFESDEEQRVQELRAEMRLAS